MRSILSRPHLLILLPLSGLHVGSPPKGKTFSKVQMMLKRSLNKNKELYLLRTRYSIDYDHEKYLEDEEENI